MAYHESFWVAVAAAAPVIALANTVVITDVASTWLSVKVAWRRRPLSHRFLFLAVNGLSGINLIDQTLALLLALKSLYSGVDAAPTTSESYVMGYGLLTVFIATVSLFHPGYASRICNTWMALASSSLTRGFFGLSSNTPRSNQAVTDRPRQDGKRSLLRWWGRRNLTRQAGPPWTAWVRLRGLMSARHRRLGRAERILLTERCRTGIADRCRQSRHHCGNTC
jgi:hypothetical protein